MTPQILGDISPDCKRQIAQASAENRLEEDQPEDAVQHQGARLVDAVHVLAANLNRLVEWHKDRGSGLGSNAALAAKAQVSSNTIGRMRRGDGSVGIGTLSSVAKALGLQANQLITPGLVPESPPELVSDEAEKNLLTAFRARRNPPDPPKLVSSK